MTIPQVWFSPAWKSARHVELLPISNETCTWIWSLPRQRACESTKVKSVTTFLNPHPFSTCRGWEDGFKPNLELIGPGNVGVPIVGRWRWLGWMIIQGWLLLIHIGMCKYLPSGNLTYSYWKSPFSSWENPLFMVIFNSYFWHNQRVTSH